MARSYVTSSISILQLCQTNNSLVFSMGIVKYQALEKQSGSLFSHTVSHRPFIACKLKEMRSFRLPKMWAMQPFSFYVYQNFFPCLLLSLDLCIPFQRLLVICYRPLFANLEDFKKKNPIGGDCPHCTEAKKKPCIKGY